MNTHPNEYAPGGVEYDGTADCCARAPGEGDWWTAQHVGCTGVQRRACEPWIRCVCDCHNVAAIPLGVAFSPGWVAPDGSTMTVTFTPHPASASGSAEAQTFTTVAAVPDDGAAWAPFCQTVGADVTNAAREAVWRIAEAFGADRNCEGCQKVARKAEQGEVYACVRHAPRLRRGFVATPSPA
jgi:hypothetical protein